MNREPNTQYVLSLSYGKDSIATLEAIRLLGYPLDRIIHAEIWATDTISADLPPMVEFKQYADKIIKERYGIQVEHICAMRDGEKLTYEKIFYHKPVRRPKRERERERERDRDNPRLPTDQRNMVQLSTQIISLTKVSLSPEAHGARNSKRTKRCGNIYGFPRRTMPFCQSRLKAGILDKCKRVFCDRRTGRDNKYGAVSRHCGRRARTNRPSYKAGNRSSVSGHRVGRGVLPQVV